MPHIVIRDYPDKLNAKQKRALCAKVGKLVSEETNTPLTAYTISFEEIAKEDWNDVIKNKELVDKKQWIVIPSHGLEEALAELEEE